MVCALHMHARCPPGQLPCTQRPGPGASGQKAVTPGVPGTKQVGLASCWELSEGRAALLIQHWDVYQNLVPSESTWQDAQRTAALPWVLRLPCFLQAWKMNNNPG